MPDAVEVVFQIDQPGTAAAKLKTLDEMMARLGRTAATVGINIDKTVRDMSADMDGFAARLQAAAAGQTQLGQAAGKGATQLSAVKTQLSGIANIPGIPAVDGLNALGGAGLAPLFGGIALGLQKINDVFVSIREESERLLKVAEKFNQMNRTGMKGSFEETKTDFEAIRKMRDDVMRLNDVGKTTEATELQVKLMGRAMTLSEMNSKFDQAKARAESMGVDTSDPAIAKRLQAEAELQKKRTGDFNELNQLRLTQQVQEMDHADKLRKAALDAQAELAKKQQEAFQVALGHAQKLGSLFDEKEKLLGGMGGADIRSKNAGIDSQRTELKKAINDAMMSGREFGPGGRRELLAQYSSLGMTSPGERLASESQERAIKLGQDKYLAAGTNKINQGLALDQILGATANIGGLSSDQVDVRLKALEQKSALEKDAADNQSKKEIAVLVKKATAAVEKLSGAIAGGVGLNVTLKDDSGGAMKAELGEAPTPESSGAVKSSPFMDSTNAYRNDPMSGRL